MKKPLFAVDEEVIIASEINPIHNGEQTICDVAYETIFTASGEEYTGWCYKIYGQLNMGLFYIEPSVKKKHKPSELSFQELVSSLKTPIKA